MCTYPESDTEGNLRQSQGKDRRQIRHEPSAISWPARSRALRSDKSSMASVCLHAKGPVTPSQTTGSMVAELRKDGRHTVWLTGSSSPCLSLFKPFYFGTDTSPQSLCGIPGSSADDSLFWKHERLHRRALKAYGPSHEMIRQAYDSLEEEFLRSEHDRFGRGVFLFPNVYSGSFLPCRLSTFLVLAPRSFIRSIACNGTNGILFRCGR